MLQTFDERNRNRIVNINGRLALYFDGLTAGDYDQNGKVDAADYDVWKSAYGAAATPTGSGADGNGDGIVDAADYSIWRDNLGASVFTSGMGGGARGAIVPEPQIHWLVAVGLTIAWPNGRGARQTT